MANQENKKSFGAKLVGFFKRIGAAIAGVWNGLWNALEKVGESFHEIYELRDYKNTSGWGIGLSILSIVCGIFHLNINNTSGTIEIGATFIDSVGSAFLLIALLLLVGGTLTASGAGLMFIFAGMTLPLVGEIVNIIVSLCTGNASYIALNWLYLVTFVAFAAVYVLTFTRVISVKLGRYVMYGLCPALAVYAVLAFVLHLAPFFADDTILVTKTIEYITMIGAMLMIHLTVFDYSSEYHAVSKAVETDDKEEF